MAGSRSVRSGVQVNVVGGDNDSERERKRLCKEASTPYPGSRGGLTSAQLAAAAQLCAGVSVPIPATPARPVAAQREHRRYLQHQESSPVVMKVGVGTATGLGTTEALEILTSRRVVGRRASSLVGTWCAHEVVDYGLFLRSSVMLVIRLKSKWTLKLDRQIGSSGKHGIWAFHCSESTFAPSSNDLGALRRYFQPSPKRARQWKCRSAKARTRRMDGSPSAQA